MQAVAAVPAPAKSRNWPGLIMSGLVILFLLMDAVMHIAKPPMVLTESLKLGLSADVVLQLGVLELLCLALYVWPRTSILGAVLLTGYLGGAVAIHVRMMNPLFSHTLFPVYVGLLLWGGLYLRDERLRALLPLKG